MFKVLTATGIDAACWANYIERLPMAKRDVHFTPAYCRAREVGTNDAARCALYIDGDEFVLQPFMLRRLAVPGLCDITSPYGFGGSVSNMGRVLGRGLWACFDREFAKWRAAHHVICEFCALYPEHQGIADVPTECAKPMVVVPIDWDDATLLQSFSRNRRRAIEAARAAGRSVRVESDGSMFHRLYQESMERLGAERRWRHPAALWASYDMELAPEHATWFFDGMQVGLVVVHGFGVAHAQYLGSTGAVSSDLIYFEAMRAMRDIGCTQFYMGGGRTSAPDDSLLAYKLGFGGRTVPLYTYRRIFDDGAFIKACADADVSPCADGFFPPYRRSA